MTILSKNSTAFNEVFSSFASLAIFSANGVDVGVVSVLSHAIVIAQVVMVVIAVIVATVEDVDTGLQCMIIMDGNEKPMKGCRLDFLEEEKELTTLFFEVFLQDNNRI